jgi:ABC-type multidrug transport system fused ATPase/permease subunit
VDIVNTFTRAAGAAQRVFALMDSLPDIDPDVGRPVVRATLRGRLTFDNVEFTYQVLLQNVFSYYRMCSLTIECVLLL